MFTIKICGVTSPRDACLAVEAGASAIGLNFYAKSPRNVALATAAKIADDVNKRAELVGVFVNAPAEEIRTIAAQVGLDWAQLHGDEHADFAQKLPAQLRILRALRLDPEEDPQTYTAALEPHLKAQRPPDAVLVDVLAPHAYGGTGRPLRWKLLGQWMREALTRPLVLAGGLTPQNVEQAVRQCGRGVAAVDTASGVESSPGKKDSQKIADFVAAAERALHG